MQGGDYAAEIDRRARATAPRCRQKAALSGQVCLAELVLKLPDISRATIYRRAPKIAEGHKKDACKGEILDELRANKTSGTLNTTLVRLYEDIRLLRKETLDDTGTITNAYIFDRYIILSNRFLATSLKLRALWEKDGAYDDFFEALTAEVPNMPVEVAMRIQAAMTTLREKLQHQAAPKSG